MTTTHEVYSVENLPIYLVSAERPRFIREDDFISGVPLGDVLERLAPGEHLYLVDYASIPGRTRLTCLA